MSRTGVAREGSPAAVHPGMVVALDVGGTAMKGAVLDADDRVVSLYRWPTPRSEGPAVVVDAVLSAVATTTGSRWGLSAAWLLTLVATMM